MFPIEVGAISDWQGLWISWKNAVQKLYFIECNIWCMYLLPPQPLIAPLEDRGSVRLDVTDL